MKKLQQNGVEFNWLGTFFFATSKLHKKRFIAPSLETAGGTVLSFCSHGCDGGANREEWRSASPHPRHTRATAGKSCPPASHSRWTTLRRGCGSWSPPEWTSRTSNERGTMNGTPHWKWTAKKVAVQSDTRQTVGSQSQTTSWKIRLMAWWASQWMDSWKCGSTLSVKAWLNLGRVHQGLEWGCLYDAKEGRL